MLLGEVIGRDGKRFDLQLKGSGRTPFSRQGDGKSSLGPVIREYLLSEAMFRLGVPTTRALAAVRTGEQVLREQVLPGAVMTRVASSHIRIGTFEYFAARGDEEAVETLTQYAIQRLYPDTRDADQQRLTFFERVVEQQASLVAQWMALGFIHGVMNTDNMSVSGETIDYGPCAFMDEFQYDKVFSSIDRHGRYAYSQQPAVAEWNLARLAECLMCDHDRSAYEAVLGRFRALYSSYYLDGMARKLGLTAPDAEDASLITRWLQHLQSNELDYTRSFRELATRIDADDTSVFGDFEKDWRQRLATQGEPASFTRDRMNAANPVFIPRNHQVERAIHSAIHGDLSVFEELTQVLSTPFTEQPTLSRYEKPPRPEQRVTQTFCGT